jgi:hypothetical protein
MQGTLNYHYIVFIYLLLHLFYIKVTKTQKNLIYDIQYVTET